MGISLGFPAFDQCQANATEYHRARHEHLQRKRLREKEDSTECGDDRNRQLDQCRANGRQVFKCPIPEHIPQSGGYSAGCDREYCSLSRKFRTAGF